MSFSYRVLQLGQTLSPRSVRDTVMLLLEYYSKNDLIQLRRYIMLTAPQEQIPRSLVGLDAEDLDGESPNLVARWDTLVLTPAAQRQSPPVAATRLPMLAPQAHRQSPPVAAARLPVLAPPAHRQSPPVTAAILASSVAAASPPPAVVAPSDLDAPGHFWLTRLSKGGKNCILPGKSKKRSCNCCGNGKSLNYACGRSNGKKRGNSDRKTVACNSSCFLWKSVLNAELENLVTTGMLEGKRSRGKQREKLIEGLTDWLKAGKSLEAIEATKDRKKWRTMIANAVKQGT
ncbi:hypothetical protein PoB_001546300 [Plakobranchus ocellatus]|uniref:Uncharacterized protein n=1 Tax=Plakobranchus ocellatus TaxID=259542 RepID=A0AAV3Z3A8_9GAST|nr:hypothetical protein PoB_001546300 [Plakobranchus ocellatus]